MSNQQQIPLDCPHCGTKFAGFEIVSFYVVNPIPSTSCDAINVLVASSLRCPNIKCRLPVAATLNFKREKLNSLSNSWSDTSVRELINKSGNSRFDMEYWKINRVWPTAQTPNVPRNLTASVSRVFGEAELNMSNGAFESAAAMYGKALDIATVQIGANEAERIELKSKSLHKRIEALGSSGRIAADLADWAKQLKWARNDSMHDEREVEKADAEAIGEATRLILLYLFEMPARAAEMKSKYAPAS